MLNLFLYLNRETCFYFCLHQSTISLNRVCELGKTEWWPLRLNQFKNIDLLFAHRSAHNSTLFCGPAANHYENWKIQEGLSCKIPVIRLPRSCMLLRMYRCTTLAQVSSVDLQPNHTLIQCSIIPLLNFKGFEQTGACESTQNRWFPCWEYPLFLSFLYV